MPQANIDNLRTPELQLTVRENRNEGFEEQTGIDAPLLIRYNDLSRTKQTQFASFLKHHTTLYGVANLSTTVIKLALKTTNPIMWATNRVYNPNGFGRWRERRISRTIYYAVVRPNNTALDHALSMDNEWAIRHAQAMYELAQDNRNNVPHTGQHDGYNICNECRNIIQSRTRNNRGIAREINPNTHTGQHPSDTCNECFEYIMNPPRTTTTSPLAEIRNDLQALENDNNRPPEIRRNVQHIARTEAESASFHLRYMNIPPETGPTMRRFDPSEIFGTTSSMNSH